MSNHSRSRALVPRALLIFLSTAALGAALAFAPSSPAWATHPSAGNCKHQHAVVRSFCNPGVERKKCKVDGVKGRCKQNGLSCYCQKPKTTLAELTVEDLRDAFDATLTELVPPTEICPQVSGPLDTVLATAGPVLADFAADPQFIDSGFLATLDSLLRDLPAVEAVFALCLQPFPADLGPALSAVKTALPPALDDLFASE